MTLVKCQIVVMSTTKNNQQNKKSQFKSKTIKFTHQQKMIVAQYHRAFPITALP